MIFRNFLLFVTLSITAFSFSSLYAAEDISVSTRDSAELSVRIFHADKNAPVLLWLPTEYGIHGRESKTATVLAENGLNVWLTDLHASYFIPHGRSSYNNINTQDIEDLIIAASNQQQREVIVFATGRAAPLAMRAVHALQNNQTTRDIVQRAVLFHPNFYVSASEVGKQVDYLPITKAVNLAVYIVQPSLSGKTYQLETLVRHLQKGGSDVMTRFVRGVADGFNVREPENNVEADAYEKTPSYILSGLKLLQHYKKTRIAAQLEPDKAHQKTTSLKTGLQPYQGNIKSIYINFYDRKNQHHSFDDHKGKVLLLNFWASWCPPCVKELPSFDRLKQKINSDQFEILAINIGEDKETVKKFLTPMNLQTPVLFDPDATSVKPWNLLAFPSSFVVGPNGKIRYGLFGGIEWDNDDVVKLVQQLLKETQGN